MTHAGSEPGSGGGPLAGIRVLDLSQNAPGPFCSMMLSDFGADVLMIEPPAGSRFSRPGSPGGPQAEREAALNPLRRNKLSIVLNLKSEEGRSIFMLLAADADVVVEGFRPGAVKRLGVDYDSVREVNPRVIYCSLSGYGQHGPYANEVGHDINYVAFSGALSVMGSPDGQPSPPLNLLADFAAGGQQAAFAIAAALVERASSGRGQYIDAAMSDGVMYLMARPFSELLSGKGKIERGKHLLSGGIPYYNTFETSDGRWLSIASIEPPFFANLCRALGCEQFIEHQHDPERRREMSDLFRRRFREETLDHWMGVLAGKDICVAPVKTLDEALQDQHNAQRDMVVRVEDRHQGAVAQIGVSPKLSRTPGRVRSPGPIPGRDTHEVLSRLGMSGDDIARLRGDGVVA